METTETKKSSKIFHIIYIILIVLILAGGGVAYYFLDQKYHEDYDLALSEQTALYDAARLEYETALAKLLVEENEWKAALDSKQEEVNEAREELAQIYAERQAALDAEEARWNSLSPEEQAAEQTADTYNQMVLELRATNPEYAALYVQFSAYLNRSIYSLGREESLAYAELYERKLAIEQEYLSTHN